MLLCSLTPQLYNSQYDAAAFLSWELDEIVWESYKNGLKSEAGNDADLVYLPPYMAVKREKPPYMAVCSCATSTLLPTCLQPYLLVHYEYIKLLTTSDLFAHNPPCSSGFFVPVFWQNKRILSGSMVGSLYRTRSHTAP